MMELSLSFSVSVESITGFTPVFVSIMAACFVMGAALRFLVCKVRANF
jgi:hypothetical protein